METSCLKPPKPRKTVEYAFDPIPAKAIGLGETYQRVLEAINADPKVLGTLSGYLQKALRQNRNKDEHGYGWRHASEAEIREYHREREASVFFRDRLSKEDLRTYVRDPETGEILQLNSRLWSPTTRVFPQTEVKIRVGMDDFVHNASGNPDTLIRGAYRPVFLWKEDFERWLKKIFGAQKRRGRPVGSGSWEAADRDLLKKMHRLIANGSAKSPNDAARLVANRAQGAGTPESKQTRLARSYRASIWSEQN